MQRAGFGVRLVASLVDAALLAALFVLVLAALAVVAAVMPAAADDEQARRWSQVYLVVVTSSLFVLSVAYTGLDVVRGATVGKRLFKLRVAPADATAAAAPRLLARWALRYSPVTALLFARAAGFTLS